MSRTSSANAGSHSSAALRVEPERVNQPCHHAFDASICTIGGFSTIFTSSKQFFAYVAIIARLAETMAA